MQQEDLYKFLKLYNCHASKVTDEKTYFMYDLLNKNGFFIEATMGYISKIPIIELVKNDVLFVIETLKSECKVHFDKNILHIQKEKEKGQSKQNLYFVTGYKDTLKNHFSIKEDNFDITSMALLDFLAKKMQAVFAVEIKRIEYELRQQILRLIEYNKQGIDIEQIIKLEKTLYNNEGNSYDVYDDKDDDHDAKKRNKPRL